MMLRRLFLSGTIAVSFWLPATGHELWIEPQAKLLARNDVLKPIVRVGQNFEGDAFSFDPSAFERLIWTHHDLAIQPVVSDLPVLVPFGDGLHILALESGYASLSHASVDDFEAYLEEIGMLDSYSDVDPALFPGGPILERYRRYTKTLVHVTREEGEDRRVGTEKEWVLEGDSLRLFSGASPQPRQPAVLYCKAHKDKEVLVRQLATDTTGLIGLVAGKGQRCLVNTVFLSRLPDKTWFSDWVSMYFEN